jgi:hypothetical protein
MALDPTLQMRLGNVLQAGLKPLRGVFPEANPYGQAIENFFLQPSEQMAGRMAEGDPYAAIDTRAGRQLVNPAVVDTAGLIPFGAAVKGATALPAEFYGTVGPMLGASKLSERVLGLTKADILAQQKGLNMEDLAALMALQHGGKLDEAMHIDMPPFREAWGATADSSFLKGSSIGLETGGRTEFLMNPTNKQIRDYFSRAEMKDGGVRTAKDADGNLYMWNADKGTHKQFHLGLEDALDKDIVWDEKYWHNNSEQLIDEFGATEKAATQNRDAPKFKNREERMNWVKGERERKKAFELGNPSVSEVWGDRNREMDRMDFLSGRN